MDKQKEKPQRKPELDEVREACLEDCFVFAQLMYPDRYFGDLHRELFDLFTDEREDVLALVPRDHQKSFCLAIWATWMITKDPLTSIACISATPGLSVRQCTQIKACLESPTYRKLWPEMLNWEKRGSRWEHIPKYTWNNVEFNIAHPKRKEKGITDSVFKATSVKSSNTGFHFKILLLDDLVTEYNYNTEAGREEVKRRYSTFASLGSNAITRVVGTTYTNKDLYWDVLIPMVRESYDENDNYIGKEKVFKTMIREVEEDGEFIWPRKKIEDGRRFGFNNGELAKRKAKYEASGQRHQFYAQYYNRPNDPSMHRFTEEDFRKLDKKKLKSVNGLWAYDGEIMNITAGMDIAYTTNSSSDWSAIVVVGRTHSDLIVVLDLKRMKTDKYNEYYDMVFEMHEKWSFDSISIETNAGANVVKKYIEDRAIDNRCFFNVVDGRKDNRRGNKKERQAQVLDELYNKKQILHPHNELTDELESELALPNPAHDDLADALTDAVYISQAPIISKRKKATPFRRHNRKFGGYL